VVERIMEGHRTALLSPQKIVLGTQGMGILYLPLMIIDGLVLEPALAGLLSIALDGARLNFGREIAGILNAHASTALRPK